MRRRLSPRGAALATVALAALAAAAAGWARAGGGHTYGGGGSSHGSGGGGGSSDGDGEILFYLLRLLFELVFEVPQIGIPIIILIVVIAIYMSQQNTATPSIGAALDRPADQSAGNAAFLDGQVQELRRLDPNFSRPLFLDFVGLLYARAAAARASGAVEPVEAYLAPQLAQQWEQAAQTGGARLVDEVVVGAVRIGRFRGLGGERVSCDIELEASYRERATTDDAGRGVWTHERWTFERATAVLSKGPEEIGKLGCPSCGAPCELKPDGRCTYCDKIVNRGDFAWRVTAARPISTRARPPEDALVSGGEEEGTDLPTRVSPALDAERRHFAGRHPDFEMAAFERMVRETFFAIQQAWTAGEYEKARPLETDNLFNTHRYWLEMYKAAGLRNVLEDIRIERLVLAKVEADAFYESITVRIFASMKDYTVDAAGNHKSGSRSASRRFSEYWTFIAAIGAPVTKGPSETSCPSCGAPVKVNQAGKCEHCDAVVTNGKFGWVLSRIEQDEAYGG